MNIKTNSRGRYRGVVIEMPADTLPHDKLENLQKLVDAKAPLLKAALGTDELPIKQTDGLIRFPWFEYSEDSETVTAYASLISLLCKTAAEKQRVTAKAKDIEGSQKYAMRCFLLSLGFIGDEHKASRKVLLSRLDGNASWKNGRTQ